MSDPKQNGPDDSPAVKLVIKPDRRQMPDRRRVFRGGRRFTDRVRERWLRGHPPRDEDFGGF